MPTIYQVSCAFTVTILQQTNMPPTIACGPDKAVNCGDPWSFDPPTATDICSNANMTLTILSTITNGTGPQVITRTWQATDAWGNTATCSQTVTILANCCFTITNETITCSSNGLYSYTFDIRNDSGKVLSHLVLAEVNGNNVFEPDVIFFNPPMQINETRHETVTLSATCGQLCFYISLHTLDWQQCCSRLHCISVPDCCLAPHVYSTAIDFTNGVLLNLTNQNAELHFPRYITPFPFYNISCSARGTLARIDVNSANPATAVVGEYRTAPDSDFPNFSSNPSRISVDLFGNIWVANRNYIAKISPGGTNVLLGSVTRYALVIGGTRVDAFGTPDANGQYLKPPFIYNSGAVGRTVNGLRLLKTSRRLGDILDWPGPELGDGTVMTPDDDCIINYTRVIPVGTRTLAVDANNDVWTSGIGNRIHERLDGFTAAEVPGTAFLGKDGVGGYGGFVDAQNVLWSANTLLRVPLPGCNGCGQDLGFYCGSYGLGIDPCTGNVWYTSPGDNTVGVHDPAGNCIAHYSAQNPLPGFACQGIVVDDRGNVWIAHSLAGANTIGHILSASGAPVGPGYVPLNGAIAGPGPHGPTGVAIDSNGKVWAACNNSGKAVRVDPNLGIGGAVDFAVDLNAASSTAAAPYNYSDNTGFVSIGTTSPSGFWDFINDACSDGADWGKLTWLTCSNTLVKVEVRAADEILDLPKLRFQEVTNGVSFCGAGITGRHLEIRIRLFRGVNCGDSPACFKNLKVQCCHSGPIWGTNGIPIITNSLPDLTNVVHLPTNFLPFITVSNRVPLVTNLMVHVIHPGGLPMAGTWYLNGAPAQTNQIAGGTPPTDTPLDFIHTYQPGSNFLQLVVSDGVNDPVSASTAVLVGDITPPVWRMLRTYDTNAFVGRIPDVISALDSSVLSDDWAPFNQINVTQTPPPGTVVTQGTHMITLIASDPAGNRSTNFTAYTVDAVLSVLSPPEYASYPTTTGAYAAVEIASNVLDVVRVNYYLDTLHVGSSTQPPFGLNLTNMPAGVFDFVAEAVNFAGLTSRPSEAEPVIFLPPAPVTLQLSATNGIVLTWPPGWTLQSATDLRGPWTNMPAATSPYHVAPNTAKEFFRLRQ
jgi:hypothetical protein